MGLLAGYRFRCLGNDAQYTDIVWVCRVFWRIPGILIQYIISKPQVFVSGLQRLINQVNLLSTCVNPFLKNSFVCETLCEPAWVRDPLCWCNMGERYDMHSLTRAVKVNGNYATAFRIYERLPL